MQIKYDISIFISYFYEKDDIILILMNKKSYIISFDIKSIIFIFILRYYSYYIYKYKDLQHFS